MDKEKLKFCELLLEGTRKFAVKIIVAVLTSLLLWSFPSFRSWLAEYSLSNESGAVKQIIKEAQESPSLEIHAVNDVWLSVAFGNAQPTYRRTLRRGESMRWDLTNYARVVFGRPPAAQVILNGRDLGIVNPSARRSETYIYNPDGTFRRANTRN